MLPQSNINSANRFPRECAAPEHREQIAGRDPVEAEPFRARLVRAVMLIVVAVAAHLFVVRAPRPDIGAPSPAEALAMPPDTVAEASTTTNTKPPDALPRVTVVTRELIAIPTTGVIPERRAKPVISGTELLAIGTSGRETTVEAAPRAIREAVYTARTDAVGAAVSQDQPADHARENAEETSEREASLKLSPISASRQPLANVPRSFTAPATERVIHAAPIVEPDRALVDRVLQQYAEAFGRLDAEATKAVYPSVDYVALRRAFNQLETQRLTFESCGITISGSGRDANARCQGEASYRPRIGPRTLHRDSREWTFDLAKADAGWQIVKATVR